MTNGENISNEEVKVPLSEERYNKVDNYFNKYMENIGLGKITESNVDKYIGLNEQKLRGFSAEECAEGAYLLNQEALFVQSEVNKHQGQLNWAQHQLDAAIAGKVQEYGGKYTTNEERRILAVKDNVYALELQGMINRCTMFITRLSYIPTQLRNMASVLLSYQQSKMRLQGKNEATRHVEEGG